MADMPVYERFVGSQSLGEFLEGRTEERLYDYVLAYVHELPDMFQDWDDVTIANEFDVVTSELPEYLAMVLTLEIERELRGD